MTASDRVLAITLRKSLHAGGHPHMTHYRRERIRTSIPARVGSELLIHDVRTHYTLNAFICQVGFWWRHRRKIGFVWQFL
jgi:hypothetical protein